MLGGTHSLTYNTTLAKSLPSSHFTQYADTWFEGLGRVQCPLREVHPTLLHRGMSDPYIVCGQSCCMVSNGVADAHMYVVVSIRNHVRSHSSNTASTQSLTSCNNGGYIDNLYFYTYYDYNIFGVILQLHFHTAV